LSLLYWVETFWASVWSSQKSGRCIPSSRVAMRWVS
jgi:hypothetical protein